ncbi:hypothetical protein [Kordiimonas pumila]|uniref:Uncharacterized protein n=1 Tax=Kordiimonas pumila TaxID=2161677 RepID=A0ABV7D904_9PROT|nr:hypothetical protein [Kordiimonas pumila]
MKTVAAGLTIILSLSTISFAADSPGQQHDEKSEFRETRLLAKAENTAESLRLACQTGLVIGGFFETGPEAVQSLHQALADCEAAIIKDPTNILTTVSLAAAISYEGKRLTSARYPHTSKKLLEKLVQENPNSAIALGALATWHSEVSAVGFAARLVLGASRKKATSLYASAFEKGLTDFGLRLSYIKFLARGTPEDMAHALAQCAIMLEAPAQTAIDKILQQKMAILAVALQTKDEKTIEAALEEISAFPTLKDYKKMPAYELAKTYRDD